MKQSAKKLLLLKGMEARLGVQKNYKDLLFGLKNIFKGEFRFDSRYGHIRYYPIYPFEGQMPKHFKHEFAIAAIVKNEGKYLKEWIEFHRLVGCTKFYIYDNNSTDHTTEILEYYSSIGIVEWVEWPHTNPWFNTQLMAYSHAICKSRGIVRWLAFIDADEFLYSPYFDTVSSFLDEYKDLPAMIVYWDMFGTSGHKDSPAGLLIENYTKKLDVSHPLNKYSPLCKSIVQPHCIKAVISAHVFETNIWPILGYDEDRNAMKRVSDIHPQKRIKLNHYYTKSMEEWNLRLQRSSVGSGHFKDESNFPKLQRYKSVFKNIHRFEIEDTEIHSLVPELKERMKKEQGNP